MTAALAHRDERLVGNGIALTPAPFESGQSRGSAAFSNQPPVWSSHALDRLRRLVDLPTGWDGHDGKPTTAASAIHALEILGRIMRPGLPLPSIMPLSNGGVQLEWHRKGWDVEMEIVGGRPIAVFTHNLATGVDEDLEIGADLSPLSAVTARITD
jgi:hypothetical protein